METAAEFDFAVRLPMERRAGLRALYALIDPRTGGVRYIGQTPDPVKRLAAHIYTRKTTRAPVGGWIRELAALGFAPTMHVFAYVPETEAGQAERRAIAQARGRGEDLVNVLGCGRDSAALGEIQRARYERERAQGITRTRTPEQRARISAATKAAMPAALTPQARAAHAAAMASPEMREKMRQLKSGHKQSPQTVAKRVASQAARPDYHELQSRASRARWEKQRARAASGDKEDDT